jgi:hypothetical protein
MLTRSRGLLWLIAPIAFLGIAAALAVKTCSALVPAPPAVSSAVTIVRPTPNVLTRIRDLKRLESVSFHMERVIDLSEKQSRLFGLVETEDALLLVAAADVRAGIDLGRLEPGDIEVDAAKGRARITLPPAEIFGVALDSQRTYVHTRRTGVLAQRQENLETRARQEAERTLADAAHEAGILPRAEDNAARLIGELVRSLGYDEVEVTVRGRVGSPPQSATLGQAAPAASGVSR